MVHVHMRTHYACTYTVCMYMYMHMCTVYMCTITHVYICTHSCARASVLYGVLYRTKATSEHGFCVDPRKVAFLEDERTGQDSSSARLIVALGLQVLFVGWGLENGWRYVLGHSAVVLLSDSMDPLLHSSLRSSPVG